MTPRPRLSKINLWQRHTELVLEILRDALLLLAMNRPPGGEPELNRALHDCILKANRARANAGQRALDHPPVWEGRNAPAPETLGSQSEFKIPDFQWGYIDHQEPDPTRSARHFVIECKRLGKPTRAGWVFNAHYVQDGIVRFVDLEWRYGKNVEDGAMVGYIESMTPDEILAEVNEEAVSRNLPPLAWTINNPGPLHELSHKLDRAFPIAPFNLLHLWVQM